MKLIAALSKIDASIKKENDVFAGFLNDGFLNPD